MKLTLRRIALRDTYTIGKLYVNGIYQCDTLEDRVRDFNHDGDLLDTGESKIYGETAIPYGTYKVLMNVVSPKYKDRKQYAFCGGRLPRLSDVKHFEGILIHIGNTAADSHGCILVGRNTVKGMVTQSTETFKKLYKILEKAQEPIWLEIV